MGEEERLMFHYPSVLGSGGAPQKHCVAFWKHDGSNMRFEWSPKRGWHKFGSRRQLLDESDEVLGVADHAAD